MCLIIITIPHLFYLNNNSFLLAFCRLFVGRTSVRQGISLMINTRGQKNLQRAIILSLTIYTQTS